MISLRLSFTGFGGGDPERIENMPTDIVLDAWEFHIFQGEYEETVMELNKVQP